MFAALGPAALPPAPYSTHWNTIKRQMIYFIVWLFAFASVTIDGTRAFSTKRHRIPNTVHTVRILFVLKHISAKIIEMNRFVSSSTSRVSVSARSVTSRHKEYCRARSRENVFALTLSELFGCVYGPDDYNWRDCSRTMAVYYAHWMRAAVVDGNHW